MSSLGSLLLSNSEYIQNQSKFYSDLLENQELTDVTLACDGYQVGVHRTVLSASSFFFREVIKNSKHQNPFIYLKSVSQENLYSLLHFIYAGEATVQTDNLETLVEIGNELKVIGLMEDSQEVNKKENLDGNKCRKKTKSRKNEKDSEQEIDPTDVVNCVYSEPENETKLMDSNGSLLKKSTEYKNLKNNEDMDGCVKVEESQCSESANNVTNTGDLATEINKRLVKKKDEEGRAVFVCTVCNKEMRKISKMKLHIEIHLEGFSHRCKYCDVIKKNRNTLMAHEWQYHTGTRAKNAETLTE